MSEHYSKSKVIILPLKFSPSYISNGTRRILCNIVPVTDPGTRRSVGSSLIYMYGTFSGHLFVTYFVPLSQVPILVHSLQSPLVLATGLGTREQDWTSFFDINPNTGVVTQKRGLNRQRTREVILTIKVGVHGTHIKYTL